MTPKDHPINQLGRATSSDASDWADGVPEVPAKASLSGRAPDNSKRRTPHSKCTYITSPGQSADPDAKFEQVKP